MILFHYALGAKSQFHLVYVFVFFLSLSASLVHNIHSRKNLYQTKSYYSIYPYQIQMMWVFQWNTIHCDWKHVSINLYEMWTSTWIYFICQRRPKKRREESERASFDALECVKGKKAFPHCSENHIRLDFPHFDRFAVFFSCWFFDFDAPYNVHTNAEYCLAVRVTAKPKADSVCHRSDCLIAKISRWCDGTQCQF